MVEVRLELCTRGCEARVRGPRGGRSECGRPQTMGASVNYTSGREERSVTALKNNSEQLTQQKRARSQEADAFRACSF